MTTKPESPPRPGIDWRGLATSLLVSLLAIFSALVIGAGVILVTSGSASPNRSPGVCDAVGEIQSVYVLCKAYGGLFVGALGNPRAIANTLVEATPYILAGLAVALGFKCGLFNIGAEGQIIMGSMAAAVAGAMFVGLPMIIHLPLALLAGVLSGALWGAVPGFLRARTGAHEVITTIMLN